MQKIPQNWVTVTPSDTIPVGPTIGLFVGGAGNLVVKGSDGNQVTLAAAASTFIWGNFTYVMATTTATGVVAARA